MDSSRIQRHLDALGLDRDSPPDAAAWGALLERLERDPLNQELHRRERYLEAVVEMQTRILSAPDDHLGAYNSALAPLGEASGAARVYLFENHRRAEDDALLLSQRAEWCAPGVPPEIDNPVLQDLAYSDFLPRWADVLGAGERIELLAHEYDSTEAIILEPQGILSLLVLPLMVDGVFTGFIGFDNCTSETRWSTLEINLLSAAATQIGLLLAQRRAQRSLLSANEQVGAARDRALEATQAKNIFLAKMSHELRTPLNAILGYTELLRESEKPEQAELDADLERIYSAGRHLLAIVDDLLDVSRIEAEQLTLRREAIDLPEFLSELADEVRHLASNNSNSFKTAIPADLGALTSDRTRVHQVLLNLLSNAFKYTRGGEVSLAVTASDDTVQFMVRDTGIGIASDQLERIFEAFAQVDDSPTRAFEGTGLGLAISRQLTHLLGGSLTVSSTPGAGSTFTFSLPRESAE